jgi:RNA polymerase sigma factor (sigma-70 family)
MHETDRLAQRFEQHRPRMTAVARRILGSPAEAEDAVQEAWLRFNRSDADAIDDLGAWLTTVVSRVCLNTLQARRAHPEVPYEPEHAEPAAEPTPEDEALLADSIGLALLVVLDALAPAERVAFVLHDMFGVPFEEIAPIVGRSEPAARKLASRARSRVRHEDAAGEGARLHQAKLVDAFLAAAREGDFEALLAVLDPEIVITGDATVTAIGAPAEVRGRDAAARFLRRARGASPALLDGMPATVWVQDGVLRVVFAFTVGEDAITRIDLIGDPDRLRELDLVIE